MDAGLTAETFAKLLVNLDTDRDRAGVKYEDLRRTLIRFFEWRGAPFPEEHADETFNRVARKLDAAIEIKNMGGYCYEVARLVCLEALKSNDNKRSALDPANFKLPVQVAGDEAAEKESRLTCLDDCLNALPAENRELVLEYYKDDNSGHVNRRRALAERLGLPREALANRVQRLRDKLERCVVRCFHRKRPI
jgi:DNA-directed RNA polymerase specialized sigma24 family protein